jgi:hypothetical protein
MSYMSHNVNTIVYNIIYIANAKQIINILFIFVDIVLDVISSPLSMYERNILTVQIQYDIQRKACII